MKQQVSAEEQALRDRITAALATAATHDEITEAAELWNDSPTRTSHDHSWAEDMDEVRANCPDHNPAIPPGIRCPGDPGDELDKLVITWRAYIAAHPAGDDFSRESGFNSALLLASTQLEDTLNRMRREDGK